MLAPGKAVRAFCAASRGHRYDTIANPPLINMAADRNHLAAHFVPEYHARREEWLGRAGHVNISGADAAPLHSEYDLVSRGLRIGQLPQLQGKAGTCEYGGPHGTAASLKLSSSMYSP
jgi:hypothetical protein